MANITCKYVQNGLAGAQSLQSDISPLISLPTHTNSTPYTTATVRLWPVIHAQYIRIRPRKWKRHIALRMELFGNPRPTDQQQIGKLVDKDSICPEFKPQLQQALINKDQESKVIQIDCRDVIKKAMAKAQCTSYGIVDVDSTTIPLSIPSSLLVFSTPDGSASERVMDELTNVGIGREFGVISATAIEWRNASEQLEAAVVPELDATKTHQGFYASVKARKSVRLVLQGIEQESTLTFDYMAMVVIAACIAAGGLGSNSSVSVVASMLVSVRFRFSVVTCLCYRSWSAHHGSR